MPVWGMPWLLPALGTGGSIAAGTMVATAAGSAASAALTPKTRDQIATANQGRPNVLPTWAEALAAYNGGFISLPQLRWTARKQGIWTGSDVAGSPFASPQTATRLAELWQGVINAAAWRPDLGLIDHLWQSEQLTEADARLWLRRNGVSDPDWQQILLTQFQPPTLEQVLVLLNREAIQPGYADLALRQMGFRSGQLRDILLSLRHLIAPPSDLIMFANRDVWEPSVVQRFQYDAEFPEEFDHWMKQQGYGGDARTPAQIAAGLPPVSWARLYWRASRTNISPSQVYEMVQRLRPGRVQRFWQPGFQPGAFTFADATEYMRVLDYPVPFRQQLLALAYRNPRLVDIDRWYDLGVIDAQEVYQIHLDLGYAPTDAQKRTDWLVRSVEMRRAKPLIARTKAQVKRAYRAGTISRADAYRMLYRTYLLGRPALTAWEALPEAQQALEAQSNHHIAAAINQIDDELEQERAEEIINDVKRRFIRGWLTELQARVWLNQAGVAEPRRDYYIERWSFSRSGPRMVLSTARIQRMLAKGVLPLADALTYLTNLGWSESQRNYLIAEARQRWQEIQLRLMEKQARTSAARQRAIAAQIKEWERRQREARAELMRQASPAQIVKWYARGIIDLPTLRVALGQRGFDLTAIAAREREAIQARRDWLENRVIKRRKLRDVANANEAELEQLAGVEDDQAIQGEGFPAPEGPTPPAPRLPDVPGEPRPPF